MLVRSAIFSNVAAVFPNVLAVLPKLHIYGESMAVMPPVQRICEGINGKAAGTCNINKHSNINTLSIVGNPTRSRYFYLSGSCLVAYFRITYTLELSD